MKKLLSDYKDEKVDELIREALKKEVGPVSRFSTK